MMRNSGHIASLLTSLALDSGMGQKPSQPKPLAMMAASASQPPICHFSRSYLTFSMLACRRSSASRTSLFKQSLEHFLFSLLNIKCLCHARQRQSDAEIPDGLLGAVAAFPDGLGKVPGLGDAFGPVMNHGNGLVGELHGASSCIFARRERGCVSLPDQRGGFALDGSSPRMSGGRQGGCWRKPYRQDFHHPLDDADFRAAFVQRVCKRAKTSAAEALARLMRGCAP